MHKALFGSVLALCSLATPSSFAQVSTGSTEVEVVEQEKVGKVEGEVKDTEELSLQAGALVTGGNTRSAAVTSAARGLLRRGHHETSMALALNYARAAVADETGTTDRVDLETTVENYQSRLRYDYFITKRVAAFLAWQMRRDRFQGLNLRMGIDPGLAYHFVRNDRTKFWGEAGYDFQYEIRTDDVLETAAVEGTDVDKTDIDHNVRLFLGFDQRLDERLQLVSGFEFYKSLINEEFWRLNWNTSLNLKIVDNFALAVGSAALYNNAPLPGVRKLDVLSSLSFVYTIL